MFESKRPPLINDLPPELRGLPTNKYGGHQIQKINPGELWKPPKRPFPAHTFTAEEIAEVNRQRKDTE